MQFLIDAYAFLIRWSRPLVINSVLLFLRIVWGWGFFIAGKAKLNDIPGFTQQFHKWGIPFPKQNLIFASSLEVVGGLMLLAGLFSRPIALLLTGNMIVALLTAHRSDVFPPLFTDTEPGPLIASPPFWFLVTCLTVIAAGPGWFSVDGALKPLLWKRVKYPRIKAEKTSSPAR